MRIGDIVLYQNKRWLVYAIDRDTRIAKLSTYVLQLKEVPYNLDKTDREKAKVVAKPYKNWPFVAISTNSRRGAIRGLSRVPIGQLPIMLIPFEDWVVDPLRDGGPLFFAPHLHASTGETFSARYRNGTSGRIVIPVGFGTMRQRQARTEPKPKSKTAFERVLEDDEVFGDSDAD